MGTEEKKEELAREFESLVSCIKCHGPTEEPARVFKGQRAILMMLVHLDYKPLVKDIAESMHFGTARAALALNDLEKQGMIVREADAEDKRKTRIALTEKGKAWGDKMKSNLENLIYAYVLKYGEDSFHAMIKLGREFTAFAQDYMKTVGKEDGLC